MDGILLQENLDAERVLEDLSSVGATSVKLLDEGSRTELLREAEGYDYEAEEELVGGSGREVRQQMASLTDLPKDSEFLRLQGEFQGLLERRFAEVEPYPFETALDLNSAVLQRYEAGSVGITPHRDGKSFINLVCVFNVAGRGRFFVCSDRSGSDSREIDASPGTATIMRAPGIFGAEDGRPFHYVTDIRERRYTFGLRQKAQG